MSSPAEAPWNEPPAPPAGPLDAEAFAALYEQHRAALYRYCLAKTGDRDRTEDIVHDVFVKAFACRDRFDPSRDFWPWLASIAARECIDSHRRRSYAKARTADLTRATRTEPCDSTSNAVLSAIAERRLADQLERLPLRQRVVLQLVAFDEWSYADVAQRLGYSLPTVKALLARARQRLRDVGTGSLGVVHGLHRRWHRAAARTQAAWSALPTSGELVGALSARAGSQLAVAAAVLSIAWGLAGADGPSTDAAVDNDAVGPAPAMVASPGTPTPAAGRRPFDGRAPREPTTASMAGDAERTANEVIEAAFPADPDDDPASMRVSSFTPSPRYQEDHTVFLAVRPQSGDQLVAGRLLVSRDGGASWQRLRASGLAPVLQLLFPPAYPRDPRLFALSAKGLQVSHDGGDSFETVLVVPGGGIDPTVDMVAPSAAAISPRFDDDDPSVLVVAGRSLFEYRADTGEVAAVRLPLELSGHELRSVAFAADDPAGTTVLLVTHRTELGAPGYYSSRCPLRRVALVGGRELDCRPEKVAIPSGSLWTPLRQTRPTIGSNVVFLGVEYPLVSFDGGRTYRPARGPWHEEGYYARDVQVVPSATEQSAIMAQRRWTHRSMSGPQLARTDDGGRTWTELTIDLPDFPGTDTAIVTATGRILAASMMGGIACSEDNGRTWARLCPTPEGA